MARITVIDNFLEDKHFKKIKEYFTSSLIPWYWINVDVPINDNQKELSKNGFFNHCIYNHWQFLASYPDELIFVTKKLNVRAPLQIRANLNFRDIDSVSSKWHVDYPDIKNNKTAIYYLNNNNGKTILDENGTYKKVDSKENRMLIFDGDIKHKAQYQTDVHKRYLLNINYI